MRTWILLAALVGGLRAPGARAQQEGAPSIDGRPCGYRLPMAVVGEFTVQDLYVDTCEVRTSDTVVYFNWVGHSIALTGRELEQTPDGGRFGKDVVFYDLLNERNRTIRVIGAIHGENYNMVIRNPSGPFPSAKAPKPPKIDEWAAILDPVLTLDVLHFVD